jgi:hypothetical protein
VDGGKFKKNRCTVVNNISISAEPGPPKARSCRVLLCLFLGYQKRKKVATAF